MSRLDINRNVRVRPATIRECLAGTARIRAPDSRRIAQRFCYSPERFKLEGMAHDHPHPGLRAGIARGRWRGPSRSSSPTPSPKSIGGLWSGSLALLADAGHMVSDAAALALTLFALRFARKAPHSRAHVRFPPRRDSRRARQRCHADRDCHFHPHGSLRATAAAPEVKGGLLLGVAAGGLAVNLAGLWLLRGSHAHDLNVRGAWLHVLTDAIGSVQAIVAGALILLYGWYWVDPLASILIALLVVYSAWSLDQSIRPCPHGGRTRPHPGR